MNTYPEVVDCKANYRPSQFSRISYFGQCWRNLVTSKHLMRALSSKVLLGELNTALWLEPFANRGSMDLGWSCRDHAWVVAMLALADGVDACVMHGEAYFVGQGHSDGVREVGLMKPHAWAGIERLGLWDLSVKSGYPCASGVGEIPLAPVAGTRFIGGSGESVFWASGPEDLAQTLGAASAASGPSLAVYYGPEYDRITRTYVEDPGRWIHSPLTDVLKRDFGRANYAALVLHIRGVMAGLRPPLSKLGQTRMWRRLEADFGNAEDRLLRLVERKLG